MRVNLTITAAEKEAIDKTRQTIQGQFTLPLSDSDMVHWFMGLGIARYADTVQAVETTQAAKPTRKTRSAKTMT